MFEMMLNNAKAVPPPEPDVFDNRTLRIQTLQAAQGVIIGFYEVEVYDASNRNLCRTTGYVPQVKYSGPGTVSAPPENTINGISSGQWQDTCYVPVNPDRSRYLQYTFAQEIVPTRVRIMFEGVYAPAGQGLRLVWYNQGWRVVNFTLSPTSWVAGQWQTLTITSIV